MDAEERHGSAAADWMRSAENQADKIWICCGLLLVGLVCAFAWSLLPAIILVSAAAGLAIAVAWQCDRLRRAADDQKRRARSDLREARASAEREIGDERRRHAEELRSERSDRTRRNALLNWLAKDTEALEGLDLSEHTLLRTRLSGPHLMAADISGGFKVIPGHEVQQYRAIQLAASDLKELRDDALNRSHLFAQLRDDMRDARAPAWRIIELGNYVETVDRLVGRLKSLDQMIDDG